MTPVKWLIKVRRWLPFWAVGGGVGGGEGERGVGDTGGERQ